MKRNLRTACGVAGAIAFGAAAHAQAPGAVLLPVRATEPAAGVTRGAGPYVPFSGIPQAPAESTPSPRFAAGTAGQQPSWLTNQMSAAKEFATGPSTAAGNRPLVPFGPIDPKPQTPPPSAPAKAPPKPVAPAAAFTAPQPQQPQAPQGVYAGPPAYRWYGWGSTTPGANPHSPAGVYPRASANWYSQTGATPGAFPVPVTYPRREAGGAEPPAYVGGPSIAATESGLEPTARAVIAELPRSRAARQADPEPQYEAPVVPPGPPVAAPVQQVPAPIQQAPAPAMVSHVPPPPAMPPMTARPAPVADTPPAPAVPETPELRWQAGAKPVAAPVQAPIEVAAPAPVPPPPMPAYVPPPAPAPVVVPAPAPVVVAPPPAAVVPPPPPSIAEPAPLPPVVAPPPVKPNGPPVMPTREFVAPPAPAPLPPASVVVPAADAEPQAWAKPRKGRDLEVAQASYSAARGHHQHDPGTTLEMSIRNACPATVRKVEINRVGGNGLVVRFAVDSELHAQAAASVVAELPELKAFDVRYEALLLAR